MTTAISPMAAVAPAYAAILPADPRSPVAKPRNSRFFGPFVSAMFRPGLLDSSGRAVARSACGKAHTPTARTCPETIPNSLAGRTAKFG